MKRIATLVLTTLALSACSEEELTKEEDSQGLKQTTETSSCDKPVPTPLRLVEVTTLSELNNALSNAAPGDEIRLMNDITTTDKVRVRRSGTAQNPVQITGALGAKLIADLAPNRYEAFWIIDNAQHILIRDLTIEGACANHADCEHAIHGASATHVRVQNVVARDFNEEFKFNSSPDHIELVGNRLYKTAPRNTSGNSSFINIQDGSNHHVCGNTMFDAAKVAGNGMGIAINIGGNAQDSVIERNKITCEKNVASAAGETGRMGITVGGSGFLTCDQNPDCDPNGGPATPKAFDITVSSNIVMDCDQTAINISASHSSRVIGNTFVNTTGIQVSDEEWPYVIENNLMGGEVFSFTATKSASASNYVDVSQAEFFSWFPGYQNGNFTPAGGVGSLPFVDAGNDSYNVFDYCGFKTSGRVDIGAIDFAVSSELSCFDSI